MKRFNLLLITISLFIFPNIISSQTYDYFDNEIKRVQLIVKGGVNISNITRVVEGASGKEKLKFGYNGGVTADIYIGKGLYMQPGAMIESRGARLNPVTIAGQQYNLTLNSVYLKFPFLFAFKIQVGNGYQSFNFAIGPYYAHGIGGSLKGKNFEKRDAFGSNGICNKSDIGITIEVQFEAPKYVIFCGSETGFSKIMKKEVIPSNFKEKIKNYSIHIGAGYKF